MEKSHAVVADDDASVLIFGILDHKNGAAARGIDDVIIFKVLDFDVKGGLVTIGVALLNIGKEIIIAEVGEILSRPAVAESIDKIEEVMKFVTAREIGRNSAACIRRSALRTSAAEEDRTIRISRP